MTKAFLKNCALIPLGLLGIFSATAYAADVEQINQTITVDQEYSWYEELPPLSYDFSGSRITNDATVTFDYANITHSNFNNVTIDSGAKLFFTNWTTFPAKTEDGSFTNIFTNMKVDGNITFEKGSELHDVNFQGLQLSSTGSITFNTVYSLSNIVFSTSAASNTRIDGNISISNPAGSSISGMKLIGTTVNGTISIENANIHGSDFSGTTVNGALNFTDITNSSWLNFSNMKFSADSVFSTSNVIFSGANFSGTQVAGEFTLGYGNYDNANFSGMTFADTSTLTMKEKSSPDEDGEIWFTSAEGINFSGTIFNGSVNIENHMLNADFSGAEFHGTTFIKSTMNGSTFDGASATTDLVFGVGDYSEVKFTNMIFGENAKFLMERENGSASLAIDTDFSGTTFGGGVTIDGVITGAIFDNVKFHGISSLKGDLVGISFQNAEFYGTSTISNAIGANFTGTKFKDGSDTTFEMNLNNAVFSGTQFESGSNVFVEKCTVNEATFDNVRVHNGANLSLQILTDAENQFTFKNSTVDAGGTLSIFDNTSWYANKLANSVFTDNIFAGSVFFGITEGGTSGNVFDLSGSTFKGTTFSGATVFRWANLDNVSFENTTMSGAVNFTAEIKDGYRVSNSGTAKNVTFKNATLSGAITVTDMDMTGAIFDGSELSGNIVFTAANTGMMILSGADFRASDGNTTRLTGKVLFDGVTMNGAKFDGVQFSSRGDDKSITFQNSNLDDSSFNNAIFDGNVTFTGGSMNATSFTNALLSGDISFKNTALAEADFSNAQAITGNVTFDQAYLNFAKFENVTFNSGNALNSQTEVTFTNSSLDNASFNGANFNGIINFNGGSMSGTTFIGTQFSGTTAFNGVYFDAANFTNAKFKNGSVTSFNSNLDGVLFSGTQFETSSYVSTKSSSVNGTIFDNVEIHNGAEVLLQILVTDGSKQFTFKNSTVHDGGKLSILADDWYSKELANSNFENNTFSGNVFFGISETASSPNYNKLNLSGSSFKGTTFDGTTDFRWVTLDNASFENVTMSGTVRMTGDDVGETGAGSAVNASFKNATLSGTVTATDMNMTGAKFDGATLSGDITFQSIIAGRMVMNDVDFRATSGGVTRLTGNVLFDRVSMTGAKFDGVQFSSQGDKKIIFQNSNLTSSTFNTATFSGNVEFSGGSNISNANFNGANFTTTSNVTFDSVTLDSAKFIGTNFAASGDNKTVFTKSSMTGVDFTDAVMSGVVEFQNINAENAVFEKAQLTGNVTFTGYKDPSNGYAQVSGKMSGANFNGATLGDGVTFTDMALEGAKFSVTEDDVAAVLNGVTFTGTSLTNADFTGATIKGSTTFQGWTWLHGATFNNVTFESSGNSQVTFENVNLTNASFDGANFNGNVSFTRTALNDPDLNLNSATFNNAQFNGTVTFSNMSMTSADFSSVGTSTVTNIGGNVTFDTVDLDSAKFIDTHFTATGGNKTNFTNSTLTGADFSGAVMSGNVNFVSNEMSGAKFSDATLSGNVTFDSVTLDSAKFIGTKFIPTGKTVFTKSTMTGVDFSSAVMSGTVDFLNINAQNAVFEDAQLTGTVTFTGYKDPDSYVQLSGKMSGTNFNGATLGAGVTFTQMDLGGATFTASQKGGAVLDGVKFIDTGLYGANFTGATITGNTTFSSYTWLENAIFANVTFSSTGDSQVIFNDVALKNASFTGANFAGKVRFSRDGWAGQDYYDGVDFSSANFLAGSEIVFDGNGGALGAMIFEGNKNLDGNLTFQNIHITNLSFADTEFGGSSQTTFTSADMTGVSFAGAKFKSGAELTIGEANKDVNVSEMNFTGVTFEANTTFNFYYTYFFGDDSAPNFTNATFAGDTNFAIAGRSTNLTNVNFAGAEFVFDEANPRTMFNMQNTWITFDQLSQTKNFANGNLDFRGMNLSGNNDAKFHGQDWRGARTESAILGGFYGNDFRGGTANAQTHYGESYISVTGELGGLSKHTADNHNEFKIREANSVSSITAITLGENSTRLNAGVTLDIGRGNHIYASGSDKGLTVAGTIVMVGNTSAIHLSDGANLVFEAGSLLNITLEAECEYILVAERDAISSISGIDLVNVAVSVAGVESTHDWQFGYFDSDMNSLSDLSNGGSLYLYYTAIPEPSTYATVLGALALAGVVYRRRKQKRG